MFVEKGGVPQIKELAYSIQTNEPEKIVSEYLSESIIIDSENIGNHFCKSECDSLEKLKSRVDIIRNYLVLVKEKKIEPDYELINEINKLMNMLPVTEEKDVKDQIDQISYESDLFSLLHNYLNTSIKLNSLINESMECKNKILRYEPKIEKEKHHNFAMPGMGMGMMGGMGGMSMGGMSMGGIGSMERIRSSGMSGMSGFSNFGMAHSKMEMSEGMYEMMDERHSMNRRKHH